MDTLSTEVLIRIFSRLSVNDKLESILACRKWHIIITENILFKCLTINKTRDFSKAIDLFNKNQRFGRQVENLTIRDFKLDIFSILSLPGLFPNLKDFIWIEYPRSDNRTTLQLPPPHVYQQEFSKWEKLVNVCLKVEQLPFASMLFESPRLTHLTSLFVDFNSLYPNRIFYESVLLEIRPTIKSMIKNIKHAPSLKRFTLNCPVLDLDDMESLHSGAPKLEFIHARCTIISGGVNDNISINGDKTKVLNADGLPIAQNRADNVKVILINFAVTSSIYAGSINSSKDALIKWLIYIGCKYNDAKIKVVGMTKFLVGVKQIPEFEQPMVTIISKMSEITSYHAFLYPITKPIMDAIDGHSGNLKQLFLYSDDLELIEPQLDHVYASRHSNVINQLHINVQGRYIEESQTSNIIFLGLSQHLQSLTYLSMTCIMDYCALTKMFQFLPSLLILTLNSIQIDVDSNIGMVPIIPSKIRNLNLTLSCKRTTSMLQLNKVMKFVLQSCSLLTHFTLYGNLSPFPISGALVLWFFYHQELKEISIDVKGVNYYTFSWETGKQGLGWANSNETLEIDDPTDMKLHVDIASINKEVIMNLKKAPVYQ